MSFYRDADTYRALPVSERQAFLRDKFRHHTYNPAALERLIVKEKPDFLAAILPYMYDDYDYLTLSLLRRLADERGMDATIAALRDSGLLQTIQQLDPLRTKFSLDAPLQPLYDHLGPPFYIRLRQLELVDTRTLHRWARAQPQPDHERFARELIRAYGTDPVACPIIICELMLARHEDAKAEGAHFDLFSEAELLASVPDLTIGFSILADAMADLEEALGYDNPIAELPNITYCAFFRYFAREYRPERHAEELRALYHRWLASQLGKT